LVWKLNIDKESVGDVNESVFGPVKEIIHGGTIDDTWEHSSPDSECITDWGEAQSKMEIFSSFVKEEFKQLIWSILVSIGLSFSSYFTEDSINLVLEEELWNIS